MMFPSRIWREKAQRYRLEAGKCTTCGYIAFPPRLICPECGAREFETITLPDTGKILTYTVIRVAPSQFTDEAPYAVGIAELTNGVKLMAQIADCEVEKIKVGMEVVIEFRRVQTHGSHGVLSYGYKFVPKWY
ncbi:MAG: Zn-ribbon domain-containing OB-fold protein [candidate division Zixibacteria bacterium]|nr:Zn-ribbon domain-containing OB-fold protein [candidate division Zixibacteria bacterium]